MHQCYQHNIGKQKVYTQRFMISTVPLVVHIGFISYKVSWRYSAFLGTSSRHTIVSHHTCFVNISFHNVESTYPIALNRLTVRHSLLVIVPIVSVR